MSVEQCNHASGLRRVLPNTDGCEECLKTGSRWVQLRLCRTCGHVGCCEDSPYRHAVAHFESTGHPIVECIDPPEGWAWCYADARNFDLRGDTTLRVGTKRWPWQVPRPGSEESKCHR